MESGNADRSRDARVGGSESLPTFSYHDTELAARLGLPHSLPACEPTDRTCKTSSPYWRTATPATSTIFGIDLGRSDGQPVLSDPFLDDADTPASTGGAGAKEKALIMPTPTEVVDRASAPSVFDCFNTNASNGLKEIEAMVDAVHGKFTSEQIDEYMRYHQVPQSGYFIAPGGPINWSLCNNDQNGSGNEYGYLLSTYLSTYQFGEQVTQYPDPSSPSIYQAWPYPEQRTIAQDQSASEHEGPASLDAWIAKLEAGGVNGTKLVENAPERGKQQTAHQTQQTEALASGYPDEQQPLQGEVQEQPQIASINPDYLPHLPNALQADNKVYADLQTCYSTAIASNRDLALQLQTSASALANKDAQIREQEKIIRELKEVINSLLAEKFGVV